MRLGAASAAALPDPTLIEAEPRPTRRAARGKGCFWVWRDLTGMRGVKSVTGYAGAQRHSPIRRQ